MDQDFVNRLQAQLAALQGWMRREHEDLAAAVADIAALTATTLGVDRTGVWLLEADRLINQAQFSVAVSDPLECTELTADQCPTYFAALEKESYILHRDLDQAPELQELLDSYYKPAGIASMLDLPVRKSGKLIGVVCIDSLSARDWSNDEVQFGASVAALVSLSVETADRRAADRRLVDQQRALQQVLDSMAEGVITIDEGGQILSNNRAAEQILGYGPEQLLSITLREVSSALADSDPSVPIPEAITQSGIEIGGGSHEREMRRKDGTTIVIRLSIAEVGGDDQGRNHYVGSFLDITEEKAQQERLRRAEALESLGHLSGGVAHDFNNMLGVVLGYAELIHNSALASDDGELVSRAEKIIHAGRRGSDLTRRLLAFSRRSPGTEKSVDVGDLLSTSEELLRKTLTPRIELTLTHEADLWPVYIDPGEFEDAILNLAVNATFAIDQRGTLELRAENCQIKVRKAKTLDMDKGEYVRVSVSDDGEGMDEATRSQVFEPFFTSRPGEGSGLGLSQVYGFAKRARGGVAISSRVGGGTLVELYFPRYHHQAEASVVEEFSSGDRPIIAHSGLSVLVVDDEPALRQLIEAVLSDSGYQVTLAEHGKQALALAESQVFDLVLSDVIMPVMDGYQLTEALLKKFPNQRIRLMTGYEQSASRTGGYSVQVALRKPFTAAELVKVVDQALKS